MLALEAGEESPTLSNMLGISVYLHHSGLNWGYNTTRQRYGCLGRSNGLIKQNSDLINLK